MLPSEGSSIEANWDAGGYMNTDAAPNFTSMWCVHTVGVWGHIHMDVTLEASTVSV